MRLATLVVLLLVLVVPGAAAAAGPYTVEPLAKDPAGQVERYRFTIGRGGTLWDLATTYLPATALEQGERKAFSYVERAFAAAYAGRAPGDVRLGDTLTVEVPAGTFVTKDVRTTGATVVYTSFSGDLLTRYENHPAVVYRLVRASAPAVAEVLVQAEPTTDPVEAAREIYGVDHPDLLQVRAIQAALGQPQARVTVNLRRPYLDEFRNWRDRAQATQPGPQGLTTYLFGDDAQSPFVRVDDGIGDLLDVTQFPRVFRIEYYRDGTVKEYRFVEPGDRLAPLAKPRGEEWSKVLPNVPGWERGQPGPFEPFPPPLSNVGALLPGRILVITWSPRPEKDAGPLKGLEGAQCSGIPIALILGAGALRLRRKR